MVISEWESSAFKRALAEAVAADAMVALANPDWMSQERAQFDRLVQMTPTPWDTEHGWLLIPTGGSSGKTKLARHDQSTLAAAVRGFCAHFNHGEVNAMGVLPLYHVGGLMGWLRCVYTGGTHIDVDWTGLMEGGGPKVDLESPVTSLVPTQLVRLLRMEAGRDWLRQFDQILIGGGPAWQTLRREARELGIRLAPSYGMTESAAVVAALRADEFLAGANGVGTLLPHVKVTVGETGGIELEGASLFHGYWPDAVIDGRWPTGDWGSYDDAGRLHIGGRVDALIISGGEKIDPVEVETVWRESSEMSQVAVVGVPDDDWGQRVVACYPAGQDLFDETAVRQAMAGRLARFKQPKNFVMIAPWPENAMGKVNRAELKKLAMKRLASAGN
ncbi:MAG: AMP-binding protein [Candidatus Synoicihabitans palmerolidicus]|nr:AMP-binding protein [Candidatus Synoicihabitans palmerolidicus]